VFESGHENLKASEESSNLKKKSSDQLGHDHGKKTASKTKKSGDHVYRMEQGLWVCKLCVHYKGFFIIIEIEI